MREVGGCLGIMADDNDKVWAGREEALTALQPCKFSSESQTKGIKNSIQIKNTPGCALQKKLAHCYIICPIINNKTEVESVQLGNTYIADMDKCPQDQCCLDKCRGDCSNLLFMFPGPFV